MKVTDVTDSQGKSGCLFFLATCWSCSFLLKTFFVIGNAAGSRDKKSNDESCHNLDAGNFKGFFWFSLSESFSFSLLCSLASFFENKGRRERTFSEFDMTSFVIVTPCIVGEAILSRGKVLFSFGLTIVSGFHCFVKWP